MRQSIPVLCVFLNPRDLIDLDLIDGIAFFTYVPIPLLNRAPEGVKNKANPGPQATFFIFIGSGRCTLRFSEKYFSEQTKRTSSPEMQYSSSSLAAIDRKGGVLAVITRCCDLENDKILPLSDRMNKWDVFEQNCRGSQGNKNSSESQNTKTPFSKNSS